MMVVSIMLPPCLKNSGGQSVPFLSHWVSKMTDHIHCVLGSFKFLSVLEELARGNLHSRVVECLVKSLLLAGLQGGRVD